MNSLHHIHSLRVTGRLVRSFLHGSVCYYKKLCCRNIELRRFFSANKTGAHTLCLLSSRSLVRLSGPDTLNYLQGLVTNDVYRLAERTPSTQYCMILNVQGRVLYDLFLYQTSHDANSTTLLVDVDSGGKEELIKLFKRYKLRKKVDIVDVSDQYKVWAQFNSASCKDSEAPTLTFQDPRVPLFGCRFISEENIKDSCDANIVEEEEYASCRYRWGIPEGVTDLPTGNCLPLESNLTLMNGVNFQKGCYIGQELTARTYHTGVIRKRLVPLELEIDADVAQDSTITTKEKGRNAGKYRNAVGIHGLGLLRMAHIKDDLVVTAKDGRVISVKPSVPEWWPSDAV